MSHNVNHPTRRPCLTLLALMCLLALSGCAGRTPNAEANLPDIQAREGSYLKYGIDYADKAQSTDGERIVVSECRAEFSPDVEASFAVSVPKSGFYRLGARVEGNGRRLDAYRFSITIDGETPFEECRQMYFERQWVNLGAPVTDVLAELTEREIYDSYARSDLGYVSDYLFFYLDEGEHDIRVAAREQPLTTLSVWFEGKSDEATQTAASDTPGGSIVIQGENPAWRNNPSILELIDRVSASTEALSQGKDLYNTIGGTYWSTRGGSISWTFDVETEGWYQFNVRCRQDFTSGRAVKRRLYMDASDRSTLISVPYAMGWQKVTATQADGDTAYFYLTKGEHTMTLAADMGELVELVEIVSSSMARLNELYRQVLVVISGDPDPYRDYHLDTKLPDVFTTMKEQADILASVSARLETLDQGKSGNTAVFDKLVMQLNNISKKPSLIIDEFTFFNNNISALATWLQDCAAQPLEIDWLEWQPKGGAAKEATSSWWSDTAHTLRRVGDSFAENYDVYTFEGEDKESVQVWISGGRDQFQTIQGLLADFTQTTGIGVELKLVNERAIMNATIAGIGPDVALYNGAGSAVLYALRHAVLDLSQFEGFDEVAADFYDSSLVPYRLNGGVYALPETQTFPVLFYRKDIMDELELAVPQTWDDVRDCLTELQKNSMTIGITDYATFLYQYGGAYYSEDGAKSLLNSPESVLAYKQWTEFFTDFSLPLSIDFLNRFRSGEVPLAVVDYGMYNSLVVFAPEILGVWDIALVPGIEKADGTIDRSVSGGGRCAYIFANTDKPESSWQFLKWWVSGDTQSDYARQIEVKLGAAARVNVASKSAFEKQMWTPAQSALLKEQWQFVVGTPEVPGGYMVGRHINNAFRKIVYQDADIRETLNEYTAVIDSELHDKRVEYGLTP